MYIVGRYRWMHVAMDACMDASTFSCVNGCMDGRMDGWEVREDRGVEERMHNYMVKSTNKTSLFQMSHNVCFKCLRVVIIIGWLVRESYAFRLGLNSWAFVSVPRY